MLPQTCLGMNVTSTSSTLYCALRHTSGSDIVTNNDLHCIDMLCVWRC